MDARLLVRSKFMVSHEFGTGDIPREPLVTIAAVKKPDEQEEMTKDWWLVSFKEPWAKPLKINRTHQQALILMFGDDTDNWTGKRIGLYALAGTFFGKRQTAVRIAGSPDLKEQRSFTVRKFGGGKDVYNLKPLGAGAAPAGPRVWDRLAHLATSAGVKMERLKQLAKDHAQGGEVKPSALTEDDYVAIAAKVEAEKAKAAPAAQSDDAPF